MNVYDVLKERGLIAQVTHEEEIRELLGKEKVTFYIGFDPTADSLHVGHFLQMVVMKHMQDAGHRPIALVGGGTGHVGEPSGRTDMRSMMTKEIIDHNCECFKEQLSRVIDFSDGKAIMVNNADWLLDLNYIEFLRDIGTCFSVNKMLTAECFKQRMEKGLTFFEFNYMLMQGYDFLHLNREYGCSLEVGGDDQWSNMLAGVDLIRRKKQQDAFCMTCTLLLNSEGKKMGKTQKGALWLDENKCPVYDFYQYFRNVEDCKVAECMRLLTFMDMKEIAELTAYQDERMNAAKERLAYEVTALVHGKEKAEECRKQARAAFAGDSANMPSFEIDKSVRFIPEIMVAAGVAPSRGEARRIIEGGGLSINDTKVTTASLEVSEEVAAKGEFVMHKGKKVHVRIILK